jgi:hypothetical protein
LEECYEFGRFPKNTEGFDHAMMSKVIKKRAFVIRDYQRREKTRTVVLCNQAVEFPSRIVSMCVPSNCASITKKHHRLLIRVIISGTGVTSFFYRQLALQDCSFVSYIDEWSNNLQGMFYQFNA